MARVNVTGFGTQHLKVDEVDGDWRVIDENGEEFVFAPHEVRDMLQICEAIVSELEFRLNDEEEF